MAIDTANSHMEDPHHDGDDISSVKRRVGAKNVASYMLLPGFIPQIKEISRSGFGYLAFLMALVYQSVRILPANHPYVNPVNIGRFGFRHVIFQARDNITFNRQNIDQVIVFGAVLMAVLLIILQLLSLIFLILNNTAWAAVDAGIDLNMFTRTNAQMQTDISFRMLREVFGVTDVYGPHTVTAYQAGLHAMFHFYNYLILFMSIIIFLYYVIVVVGETATTGTPFGRRFNTVYAPLRLIIGIGLLVPLAPHGFNGAQYIVFYGAKLGSNLGTNGWVLFNAGIDNPTGNTGETRFIAQPASPQGLSVVEFISIARTCKAVYARVPGTVIEPYIIDYNDDGTSTSILATLDAVDPYIEANPGKDMIVVFGEFDAIHANIWGGSVKPYCGEMKVPLAVSDMESIGLTEGASPVTLPRTYVMVTLALLWNANDQLEEIADRFSHIYHLSSRDCPTGYTCDPSPTPDPVLKERAIDAFQVIIEGVSIALINAANNSIQLTLDEEVLNLGWGGAGIWYNQIAQVNGAFVVANLSVPEKVKYPMVMEELAGDKTSEDTDNSDCKKYEAYLADNRDPKFSQGTFNYYAKALSATFQYWRCDETEMTSNFIWDTMNAVFGIGGIFNMRINGAEDVHPLAKLSNLGKGLVESAVRNMGFALAGAAGGGAAQVLNPQLGGALAAGSSAFVSIATIGLSIGFVLYYILPFMPFIYVFFAVGAWVKSIFEAMVGVPLWALVHMRIEEDGIPGKMAMNGYFLIFEIGLRPILTIFGLVGSMIIFTSMVTILDEVFDLVVENITNTKIADGAAGVQLEMGRHVVDQFFFTVLYTIVVYMMAISSFKMINLVPNNVLRWIGAGVSAFSDNADDPTKGLAQYASIGGNQISGKIGQGLTSLGSAGGQVAGQLGKS